MNRADCLSDVGGPHLISRRPEEQRKAGPLMSEGNFICLTELGCGLFLSGDLN